MGHGNPILERSLLPETGAFLEDHNDPVRVRCVATRCKQEYRVWVVLDLDYF